MVVSAICEYYRGVTINDQIKLPQCLTSAQDNPQNNVGTDAHNAFAHAQWHAHSFSPTLSLTVPPDQPYINFLIETQRLRPTLALVSLIDYI